MPLQKGHIIAPLEARFAAKFFRGEPDECWPWEGFVDKAGYGRLRVGPGRDGESGYAHRVSYELHKGPIPEGLVIDHLCRVPRCVNPAHLEVVTQRENVRRGEAAYAQQTGRCARGHERSVYGYTAPNGRTSCRECKRLKASGQAEMLEKQLQHAVVETAQVLRWRLAHFRAAMTERGWRTPVAADAQGFPDLVLLRERAIFAELKRDSGKVAPAQKVWLLALRDAGQEVYVVRPRNLDAFTSVLMARRPNLDAWPRDLALAARAELNEELDRDLS